jgi:hypothetical protein
MAEQYDTPIQKLLWRFDQSEAGSIEVAEADFPAAEQAARTHGLISISSCTTEQHGKDQVFRSRQYVLTPLGKQAVAEMQATRAAGTDPST